MSIALPKPVAAYFAAEKRADADALARCFVDVASCEMKAELEPISAVERGGKTVANLEHIFGLDGDKIASPEIR